MGKPAQLITRQICEYLTLQGWHIQRLGYFQQNVVGAPDLQAHKKWTDLGTSPLVPTLWLCIEVKAEGDRLSLKQQVWLAKAQKAGAFVIVATCLGDVVGMLEWKGPDDTDEVL